MASEKVEKIVEAENKANENIKKANDAAEKIIDAAARKAQAVIKEAEQNALEKKERLLSEHRAKGEMIYAESNKKADEEIKFILQNANQRESACIYSIVKEIIPEKK